MLAFLARRAFSLLVTLFVASFLIFASVHLAPGNPISFLTGGRSLSQQQLAALNSEYHLNDPILLSYWYWLMNILHGNLGTSILYSQSVSSLVSSRVPTTALLVTYASTLIILAGVTLGVLSALRGGWIDGLITLTTSVGLAIPSFVAAAILTSLLAVQVHWFPVFGSGHGLIDRLWHLTLPAVCLTLATSAYVARITRTAIRVELAREHVDTARSRGFPESRVVWRHVVRNALIPITTVAGLTIAGLIAAAVVVETAFGLNGVGSYLVSAIQQKDFPVVQAIMLILVATFVVVNTIVDVLYVMIDPRIEVGRGRHE